LPACFQPTTTVETFALSESLSIPDNDASGVTTSINVSGADSYLWDVNLWAYVDHDYNEDVDMFLTGPNGVSQAIITDKGGDLDGLFVQSTVWDDHVLGPVTDNEDYFTDQIAATPLAPEGTLAHFIGLYPNGQWDLTVVDDADHGGSGDEGSLSAWSMGLTTLATTPRLTSLTISNSSTTSIDNLETISAPLNVANAVGYIVDLNLTTHIQHTFNDHLDVTLLTTYRLL
jgi:subtilisin-like proprotein convertase family protein